MKKDLILNCSVLALAATAMTAPAIAQDEGDVVVVKGIRASLANSAAIKRDSQGVVDAITAEDIGDFPDTNLAESLQRISGVSIDRANNEGARVTVRGFGPNQNLVTLNGRQMPGAIATGGTTRSFNFSDLAAEGVSGVEVYKTGRAEVYSGGIGATINLKTARPLDLPEFQATLTAKGVHDTSVENGSDFTPEVSGLVSWTSPNEMLGVLVNGAWQKRDSANQNAQVSGWLLNDGSNLAGALNDGNTNSNGDVVDVVNNSTAGDDNIWVPRDARFDLNDVERERINFQGVLQFRPVETITATFDYTMSQQDLFTESSAFGVWFNAGSNVIDAEIDENGTVTYLNEAGGSWDYFGLTSDIENRNKSFGANIEWQAADSLKFTFDGHMSDSDANAVGDGDFTLLILGHTLADDVTPPVGGKTFDLRGGYDIPAIGLTGETPLVPSTIDANLAISNTNAQEVEINQIFGKADWENLGDGAIKKITAGASYTDLKSTNTFKTNFFKRRWPRRI